MSVLVKGMEMPKDGTYSIVHIYSDGHVSMPFWGKGMQIVSGITAVPIPPHGDLIDINALKLAIVNVDYVNKHDYLKGVLNAINNAPTVISADKDGKDGR